MLEAIKNISLEGKKYNQEAHVASLIKDNYERLKEVGGSIHLSSFSIWIIMTYIFQVNELRFTGSVCPPMKRFCFFVPKGKITGSTSAHKIFNILLQVLKLRCHKCQVSQNIRQSFPLIHHIEIDLDYTKIWCIDDQAVVPVELDCVPSFHELFKYLTTQLKMAFRIPPQAQQPLEDLFISLDDAKIHDRYEASLYMQRLMKTSSRLDITTPPTNDPPL